MGSSRLNAFVAFAALGAATLCLATASERGTHIGPGVPVVRAAVQRNLTEGFSFVETATGPGTEHGRIESGTWQPPHAERRRIHWGTAEGYSDTSRRDAFTEIARIGVDSYSRTDLRPSWRHSRNRYELWPVYLLRHFFKPRWVGGNEYESAWMHATAWVEHGHITRLVDQHGYSYVFDGFGECRVVRHPQRFTEAQARPVPSPPDYPDAPEFRELIDEFIRDQLEQRRQLQAEPVLPNHLCP